MNENKESEKRVQFLFNQLEAESPGSFVETFSDLKRGSCVDSGLLVNFAWPASFFSERHPG